MKGGYIPFYSGVPTIQTENKEEIKRIEEKILEFKKYFEKNLKKLFYTHSESLKKIKERIELFCHDSETKNQNLKNNHLHLKKKIIKILHQKQQNQKEQL